MEYHYKQMARLFIFTNSKSFYLQQFTWYNSLDSLFSLFTPVHVISIKSTTFFCVIAQDFHFLLPGSKLPNKKNHWFQVSASKLLGHHGTVIRTGITFKKISCYMHDSAYRWLVVENAKIFRSSVKHFWIFPRERNCRILIGLYK